MSYKILSLDGGGIHGYATILILKRLLEEKPDLIDKVDLITGTSIGGILALGLAAGHNIDSVDDNFVKGIPLAFYTNPIRLAFFYAGLTTKYDNSRFKVFLRSIFGLSKLKELQKKIVIPAFCLDDLASENRRWRAKIFHNFEGVDSDGEDKVLDVGMATSAVPVYFPSYNMYIDGAMAANNPAFCAIAQTQDLRALINPRPKLDEICVLSIGTIRNIYIENRSMNWGYLMWVKSLLNMFTERDTLIINYLGNIFLGDKYHRVEPVVNGPMDNFDEIHSIKQTGLDYPINKTVSWLKEYWS